MWTVFCGENKFYSLQILMTMLQIQGQFKKYICGVPASRQIQLVALLLFAGQTCLATKLLHNSERTPSAAVSIKAEAC